MIDWHVVIAALALIPIVSLLAFVGCVVDRSGQGTADVTATFSYDPGLTSTADGPAVEKISWTYTMPFISRETGRTNNLDVGGGERGDTGLRIDPMGDDDIPETLPLSLPFGHVPHDPDGNFSVTCTCELIVPVSGTDRHYRLEATKTAMDGMGPAFRLSRMAPDYFMLT